MKVLHYSDVPAETVEEAAKGVKIRWIITEADGARNFSMRHFEIAPGGYTPHHAHPWEHEVFILSGSGAVLGEGTERPFSAGDVIFIPPSEKHQFKNPTDKPLTLLCLIPSREKCEL